MYGVNLMPLTSRRGEFIYSNSQLSGTLSSNAQMTLEEIHSVHTEEEQNAARDKDSECSDYTIRREIP